MEPDTLRRLLMQLLAPLVVIASKRLGVDLGPVVDSVLVLGAAVYVAASNWRAAQVSAHAAAVAVAQHQAAAAVAVAQAAQPLPSPLGGP